jgi:hypothetical protein
MDDGSPRFQAARWVITLGRIYWALLAAGAAWSLLAAVFTWSLVVLVVPLLLGGWAAAWGALVRRFERHGRGAWRLLVGLAAFGVLVPLTGWLLGRPPTVWTGVDALVHVGLLALLLHHDSREWVAGERSSQPVSG